MTVIQLKTPTQLYKDISEKYQEAITLISCRFNCTILQSTMKQDIGNKIYEKGSGKKEYE